MRVGVIRSWCQAVVCANASLEANRSRTHASSDSCRKRESQDSDTFARFLAQRALACRDTLRPHPQEEEKHGRTAQGDRAADGVDRRARVRRDGVALNFTFHWVTVKDGVFGAYGVPQSIQLALPAIFVGWGLYFLSSTSFTKTVIAAVTGTIGATLTMAIGPKLADSPDFWGLGVMIGITAAGLVVLSTVVEDDRFAPAPAFCAYASVFFWWIATGLDNFVPGGKGPHTADAVIAAITNKPLSAGTGAFGGLLSMSWQWVADHRVRLAGARRRVRHRLGLARGRARARRRAQRRAEGGDQRVAVTEAAARPAEHRSAASACVSVGRCHGCRGCRRRPNARPGRRPSGRWSA